MKEKFIQCLKGAVYDCRYMVFAMAVLYWIMGFVLWLAAIVNPQVAGYLCLIVLLNAIFGWYHYKLYRFSSVWSVYGWFPKK